MTLGVSYIVCDGSELLRYALTPIRPLVDYVSVVYQTVSFQGVPAPAGLVDRLEGLRRDGLVDALVRYEPEAGGHTSPIRVYKHNELKVRNLGLDLSAAAGCTHHISADADELYEPDRLQYVKTAMAGHDCSVVRYENYFKSPTYRITPNQGQAVTLIHPVASRYAIGPFPHRVEITRRPVPHENVRVFSADEFVVHHMSFVRRDIEEKLRNSPSWPLYNRRGFLDRFHTYRVGDRLQVAPDFIWRRTVEVPNLFGIHLEEGT